MIQLSSKQRIPLCQRYDVVVGNIIGLYFIIYGINAIVGLLFKDTLFDKFSLPLLGIVYVSFFIVNIRTLERAIPLLITFECFMIMLVLLSITRNTNLLSIILKKSMWTLAFCTPFLVLIIMVNDLKVVFYCISKSANLVLAECIFIFLLRHKIVHGYAANYDMTFSYMLLFPTLIHLEKGYKNKLYWLLSIGEIIMNIVYGTRGALLCIGIYILYSFIANLSLLLKKLYLVLFFPLFTTLFFCKDILMSWLHTLYTFSNIQSRTLDMLFNNNVINLTSRGSIYLISLQKTFLKPVIGWGIAGEYNFMDSYPHNIFLELFVHFGIAPIVFLFLITVLAIFLLVKKGIYVNCFMTFLCLGFIPLMISSTYLQKPEVWIWFAICLKGGFLTPYEKYVNSYP